MRQIPGVRNVALALYTPMSGNNWQSGATLEEHPERRIFARPGTASARASSIPSAPASCAAAVFTDRDTPEAAHVAVINQAFADAYLPNEDPIGKRFGLGAFQHRADYTDRRHRQHHPLPRSAQARPSDVLPAAASDEQERVGEPTLRPART